MRKQFAVLLLVACVLACAGCELLNKNPTAPPPTSVQQSVVDTLASRIDKPSATASASQADINWWRSMSQVSRNMAVLDAAYANYFYRASLDRQSPYAPYSGWYTCKTWVQQVVVPNASRGVASVPTNNGSCSWYGGCYASAWGGGIRNVGQGMIVQTRWGGGLHTAIVYARDPNGMWWIDCNWGLDSRIRIHYVTFGTFDVKSGGCYTIYQINGGC